MPVTYTPRRVPVVALGALAAAGAAGAGTVTLDGDLNEASIGNGAVVTAVNGVDVRAKTNQDFDNSAIGGSISLVFAAAVGAGFNYTNSEARAQVDGSVNVTAGDLNVIATTDVPNHPRRSASPRRSDRRSRYGRSKRHQQHHPRGIGGSGTIKANTVRVRATDTSALDADAGALSASLVGAAGASIAANVMNNTVEALIDGASVTTTVGDVDVTATSNNDVDASALGLSVAGLVAGVGSVSVNDLSNITSASLRTDANIVSAGNITVHATDTSPVQANSGGLAASLGVGVGASVALNTLNNTVEAFSDGADATLTGQLDLTAAHRTTSMRSRSHSAPAASWAAS